MLVVDLLGRSLPGEVHVTSQGWQNAHNYLFLQSNIFYWHFALLANNIFEVTIAN